MCYSVVDPTSFENIKKKWIVEIKGCAPDAPFIIVGTKTDLRGNPETLRELESKNLCVVTKAQGEALCAELKGHRYLECSALTQSGLKDVFDECIRCFVKKQMEARSPKPRCSIL
jgi:Ras-related C3 botulinum toxin substrate 1